MKLNQISLFFIIMLFVWFGFWQSQEVITDTGTQTDLTTQQETLTQSDEKESIDWKYGVFFCNDQEAPSKELQITTMPWQSNQVCLYFINDSNTDIQLEIGITDWVEIWWEEMRVLDCKFPENPWTINNYIQKDRSYPVVIPANTRVTKYVDITFPIGVEWQIPACLIYSILWETKPWWDMFQFKFRESRYLDFFIVWEFTWENNMSISNVNSYLNPDWQLTIDWSIHNDSALNNLASIQWSISSIFGYSKEFSINDIKIKAWSSAPFSNKDLNLNNYLPRYKWFFNIKLDITYKPYFDFDISNINIDPKTLEAKQLSYTTNYFEMPWIIIWWLVLFIILLFLIFRKPKVVYIQQATPPNTPSQ